MIIIDDQMQAIYCAFPQKSLTPIQIDNKCSLQSNLTQSQIHFDYMKRARKLQLKSSKQYKTEQQK